MASGQGRSIIRIIARATAPAGAPPESNLGLYSLAWLFSGAFAFLITLWFYWPNAPRISSGQAQSTEVPVQTATSAPTSQSETSTVTPSPPVTVTSIAVGREFSADNENNGVMPLTSALATDTGRIVVSAKFENAVAAGTHFSANLYSLDGSAIGTACTGTALSSEGYFKCQFTGLTLVAGRYRACIYNWDVQLGCQEFPVADPVASNAEPPTNTAPESNADTSSGAISGPPAIVDTATYIVHGVTIHLYGLTGAKGEVASEVDDYVRRQGGSVTCTPYGQDAYTCTTPYGSDMAAASLVSGWAFAASDAPQDYIARQQQAESNGIGVWEK